MILGAFKPSCRIYVVRKRWYHLFQFLLLFFFPFKLLIDLRVFNLGTALEIKVLTRVSSKLYVQLEECCDFIPLHFHTYRKP